MISKSRKSSTFCIESWYPYLVSIVLLTVQVLYSMDSTSTALDSEYTVRSILCGKMHPYRYGYPFLLTHSHPRKREEKDYPLFVECDDSIDYPYLFHKILALSLAPTVYIIRKYSSLILYRPFLYSRLYPNEGFH